jgi:hypothetical protein
MASVNLRPDSIGGSIFWIIVTTYIQARRLKMLDVV